MSTVRRVHVSDIDVVCSFAGQKRGARRTAERYGAVVSMKGRSLLNEMVLKMGHIIQRLHVQVLVVG